MRRAATLLLAVATGLAACSPPPRSTAYFDAHSNEIDAVLAACASGAHRGGECDTAGSAKAHRAANARMSVYRRTFEADRAR